LKSEACDEVHRDLAGDRGALSALSCVNSTTVSLCESLIHVLVEEGVLTKAKAIEAAAVRELLKRGLAAEGFEIAVTGMKSQSFGVLGRNPNAIAAAVAREGIDREPNQD
jgi:hypothetical protein